LTVGDGDLSFSLALTNWFWQQHENKILCHVSTKSSTSIQNVVGGLKKTRPSSKACIDVTASVYDTRQELYQKYEESTVAETVRELAGNGAQVYYGVDATKLDTSPVRNLIDKDGRKFDRIVFNFPHAGQSQNTGQ
jgi:hypothetical protein